jgi:hypothetical protein
MLLCPMQSRSVNAAALAAPRFRACSD